ncbi:MAG: hypothetical protein IJF07_08685 [Lachnospiraceae bacterium]|nr:hypothetical protein [Lachnospiraceae bacterium]
MQKAHSPINWENYPSEKSAVNATNLNNMDRAIGEIDDRVIHLDVTKFDKTSASGLITNFDLDTENGVITLTYYSGSKKIIPTNMAKIALNITYDAGNERLVLHMPDGTEEYVDMKSLITQFEFIESDTIYFEVTADGKVKSNIKDGSVTPEKLRPDYLADITVQAETATQKAAEAATQASLSTMEADRAKVEADKAAQYAQIVAPDFYFDVDTMTLYQKTGAGVDFIVADANVLCWKIA